MVQSTKKSSLEKKTVWSFVKGLLWVSCVTRCLRPERHEGRPLFAKPRGGMGDLKAYVDVSANGENGKIIDGQQPSIASPDARRPSTGDIMATTEVMANKLDIPRTLPLIAAHEDSLRSMEGTIARQQLIIKRLQDELLRSRREDEDLFAQPAPAMRRKTPNRRRSSEKSGLRTTPTTYGASDGMMDAEAFDCSAVGTPRPPTPPKSSPRRDATHQDWQKALKRNAEANKSARAKDWALRAERLNEVRHLTPSKIVPWHLEDGKMAHANLAQSIAEMKNRARSTDATIPGDERLGRVLAGWPSYAERREKVLTILHNRLAE